MHVLSRTEQKHQCCLHSQLQLKSSLVKAEKKGSVLTKHHTTDNDQRSFKRAKCKTEEVDNLANMGLLAYKDKRSDTILMAVW